MDKKLVFPCRSKSSASSLWAKFFIKSFPKVDIYTGFNCWDIARSKLLISSIMWTKFNLTESCFFCYRNWSLRAIKKLHKIFSSIVAIDDSYAICKYETIFEGKRASSIHSTVSTCRNIGFDSTFYEFDLSRSNRDFFRTFNVSACCFRSFFLWEEGSIIATDQDFIHFFSSYNPVKIFLFKIREKEIWFHCTELKL